MGMNVSGNPMTLDWTKIVGQLGAKPLLEAKGVEKTEGAAKTDEVGQKTTGDSNLKMTVADTGPMAGIASTAPDLEIPGKTDNMAGLNGAYMKLFDSTNTDVKTEEKQKQDVEKLMAEVSDMPLMKSAGGILFDIYALMVLMLQASQTQRDAARETRLAENAAIQTAIQNQADAQRSAALGGMIAGLVVCAIQIGASSIALKKSMQGAGMQKAAMQESGIDAASQNVKTAQTKVNMQTENLEGAQGKVNNADAKLTQAKANQAAAQKEFDAADQTVQSKTAARNAAQEKLDNAKGNLSKSMARKELDAASKELSDASATRDAAKAKLTKADDGVKDAQGEYDAASKELGVEKTKLEQAGQDLADAETQVGKAQSRMNNDLRQISGNNMQTKWRNIGDMITAAGGAAQQTVRSATEMVQAEATELGAEVKKEEHNLDLTRDLYTQAQDVIRAVLSLFSSVIQAETQSMRDAIQA